MAAQLEVVADFALCSRRPRAMATAVRTPRPVCSRACACRWPGRSRRQAAAPVCVAGAAIGLEAKANLDHVRRLDHFAEEIQRRVVVQLHDKRLLAGSKLQHMGAGARRIAGEAGFRFGIEADERLVAQLRQGEGKVLRRAQHMDVLARQGIERRQQFDLLLARPFEMAASRLWGLVRGHGSGLQMRYGAPYGKAQAEKARHRPGSLCSRNADA